MSDKELIIYLCTQLWNCVSDGNEPDLANIEKELRAKGINPEEIFIY